MDGSIQITIPSALCAAETSDQMMTGPHVVSTIYQLLIHLNPKY